jgi:hypothetical protein
MVLFAQGMTQTSNRPSVVDIQNYISQTVLWCSKLEAGAALVALGQKQAGIGLMVESVKAVEGGKNPRVILDALLGVAKPLSLLDPIRARSFLETAVDLATSLQLPGEATTANRMLAALHPSPPAAMAAAHH